jgi:uncharacterized protein YukE
MKPQRYRTVYKKIHPPEADKIANVYHKAKNEVSQDRARVNKILQELDSEWEGSQKSDFMNQAPVRIQKLVDFYDYLDGVEKQYRTIEVTVEVQEPIPMA